MATLGEGEMDVWLDPRLHLSPLIAAIQNIKDFLHVHGIGRWTCVSYLSVVG